MRDLHKCTEAAHSREADAETDEEREEEEKRLREMKRHHESYTSFVLLCPG